MHKNKLEEDLIDNTYIHVQKAVNRNAIMNYASKLDVNKVSAIKEFSDVDLSERSDSLSDYH